jgi:hypothetical protein
VPRGWSINPAELANHLDDPTPHPGQPTAVIASCAFAVSKQPLPEGSNFGVRKRIFVVSTEADRAGLAGADHHLKPDVDVKQVPIHRHGHTRVSIITDLPIIAGMTQDPKAC